MSEGVNDFFCSMNSFFSSSRHVSFFISLPNNFAISTDCTCNDRCAPGQIETIRFVFYLTSINEKSMHCF